MHENSHSVGFKYDVALEGVFRTSGPCHYCSMFDRPEEQLSTVVPFLAAGLMNGEKCVYICDSTPKDDIIEAVLSHPGIDVAEVEKSLSVLTKDVLYVNNGRFDLTRVLNAITDLEKRSLVEGYSGLRGAGEMSWATPEVEGSDKLIEYEARLNNLFPDIKARLLCQYDEHEFDSRTLLDALRVHPRVVVRGTVCQNPYYIPPDEFISQMNGEVSPVLYERVSKDILKRTRFTEIHMMELKEFRRANRKLDMFNHLLFSEIENQISIMSFFGELALDACKEPSAREYVQEIARKCGEIQKHIDFMKAYQMIGVMECQWQPLANIIDMAVRSVGADDILIGPRLEGVEILADDLIEGAFHAVLENLRRACQGDLRVEVSSTDSPGDMVVGFEGRRRESKLEGDLSSMGCCATGFGGSDMLLAKEMFQTYGMKTREVGMNGKLVRFEIAVPPTRFRLVK